VVEILGYTYVYQGTESECYYYQCGCTSDCWTTRLYYSDSLGVNGAWSVDPEASAGGVYTKDDYEASECGPLGTYWDGSNDTECTLVCECCDPCTEIAFGCSIDGDDPPNCV